MEILSSPYLIDIEEVSLCFILVQYEFIKLCGCIFSITYPYFLSKYIYCQVNILVSVPITSIRAFLSPVFSKSESLEELDCKKSLYPLQFFSLFFFYFKFD